MISIIAAVGQNNELGKNNELLWHLSTDLKFFKKMTINHTIVMGRLTFESLHHPLANRYNIVVSTSLDNTNGVEVVHSFEEIVSRFLNTDDDVFIIGGSSLYKYFLPYADKIYLAEIPITCDADVYFPVFDKKQYEKSLIDEENENGITYQHVLYKRSN
jgi:dihydrofolate reductase